MDIKKVDEIRKIVIIALFSDDDLMDQFVLKGGNAINIIYGLNSRSSQDIDISIPSDFKEIEVIKSKLKSTLISTFKEYDYHVFDVTLIQQPVKDNIKNKHFWGGYKLEFKIIEKEKHEILKNDVDRLRKSAISLNDRNGKKFKVDISKYEYCDTKESAEIEGYTIYVYTPIMLIYEKLRAICQQMDDYLEIIEFKRPTPRARDFFDICIIIDNWPAPLNLCSPDNLEMLRKIFEIKKVPLDFLGKIKGEKEFHKENFKTVRDTVDFEIEDFDFYFDKVLKIAEEIRNALEQTTSNDY